ncbi:MAG TPA: leucyl/phenylalanyl-tRNA--protein transferase [Edaphocola sp.]|nr:leucyl/phenylalanyl-tRNA--protein transferase [Edaphocola sp.]
MINFLPSNFSEFPDVSKVNDFGLLAVGGNLKPETLLKAYSKGIFPWYSEDEPICWYAPKERCVLYPEKVKISKSMKFVLKSGRFRVTQNEAFEQVIRNCSSVNRKDQDGTWIVPEMEAAFIHLHQLGHAISLEVWQENQLVGGLYGIKQERIFCGESMFSLVSNASKVAFIYLCQNYNYELIDCQLENPHLLSLGAELIPRAAFSKYLQKIT